MMTVLYRSISRDFFSNAYIAELSPLARLLYIAIWLEADREGRLVWHPKTLRLRYLPLDACDIDSLADELVSGGFVVPYVASGEQLAFIADFARLQVINNKERASQLPPPDLDAIATRRARDDDATVTRPHRDASRSAVVECSGLERSGIPSQGFDGQPTEYTGGGAPKIPRRKFVAMTGGRNDV
jgi:hypothetical protein